MPEELAEDLFGTALDEIAEAEGISRDELKTALVDDLGFWLPGQADEYEDEDVIIVRGTRDELDVPDEFRDAVQAVHNRTANEIAGHLDYITHRDVYVAPKALSVNNEGPDSRGEE
jgi:hypothetical protein